MTEAEILASLVRRIEAVREEKKLLSGSERDLFAEAKGKNIDGKALRRVLQRRAMGDAAVAELDAIVDAYEAALGAKSVAAEELRRGASVRQAARKAGVSVATAQRSKTLISETPPSTGGGSPQPDPTQAASAHPQAPDIPPVEPVAETDRAGTTSSAPEGPGGEEPPRPDPDDRAIRPATPTEVEAIQAAIDRHNAGKTTAAPDAPLVLPAFLKRGTPEHEAAVKGART